MADLERIENDRFVGQREAIAELTVRKRTAYAVPVAPGVDLVLEGQFPMSPVEWQQMMTVLEAMRPALVRDAPEGS